MLHCCTVPGQDRWHQIFDANRRSFHDNGPNALKSRVTPDGVEWVFEKSNFVGHQLNVADIRSVTNEEPIELAVRLHYAMSWIARIQHFLWISVKTAHSKPSWHSTILNIVAQKVSVMRTCSMRMAHIRPLSQLMTTIKLYLDPELNKLIVNHANGYVTDIFSTTCY